MKTLRLVGWLLIGGQIELSLITYRRNLAKAILLRYIYPSLKRDGNDDNSSSLPPALADGQANKEIRALAKIAAWRQFDLHPLLAGIFSMMPSICYFFQ
jgi:hypothetical protein